MQVMLDRKPAQLLEEINAGYPLLQRTTIQAGCYEERNTIRNDEVCVVVNLLQFPILFQKDNMLRVRSDDVRRLAPALRVSDNRRADLV
jgi:hypothetical protein